MTTEKAGSIYTEDEYGRITGTTPKARPAATHTPGPWVAADDGYGEDVDPSEPGKRWIVIQTPDGKEVAVIVNRLTDPTADQWADARLIVAAPNLLRVMRYIHETVRDRADPSYDAHLAAVTAHAIAEATR